MAGVSRANLLCIKCCKTFTNREGATVKGSFFFCKECTDSKKLKENHESKETVSRVS